MGAKRGMALSGVILAGVVMMVNGIFQAVEGFAAIWKKDFYTVTENYVFEYSVTQWGWVHLIMGAIVALAGICVLAGQLWARITAVILAMFSAIANFLFIPYYPVWSIVIVALDLFVIWALIAYQRDEPRDDAAAREAGRMDAAVGDARGQAPADQVAAK